MGLPIGVHLAGQWSMGRGGIAEIGKEPGSQQRGEGSHDAGTVPNQLDELLCGVVMCGILMKYLGLKVVLGEAGFG